MITFKNKKYEHFFSNDIVPLQALAFAGEEFFEEYENLCGSRYRLLSVIRHGEQDKYGLEEDVTGLAKVYHGKLNDSRWIQGVLNNYESVKGQFKTYLKDLASLKFEKVSDSELSKAVLSGFELGVKIAAISNMLHMFSSLLEDEFFRHLSKYSNDAKELSQNKIYYTQPLRESQFSKILLPKLKGAFSLDEKEKNFSTILRTGAYVKGDGSALFAERAIVWEKLLSEIAKRFTLSDPVDTLYLFPSEIKKMLSTRKVPAKLISQRKALTVLFYQKRKLETYEGDNAEYFLKEGGLKTLISTDNIKTLKGQPASPGKVKGMAVVTSGLDNALALVKKGDILVTVYTSARYVPAMEKAAAIITETGGITAHAAVVSRELGVPCVIAVKDATKLIHTGDLLEVDADKGVVTIVKKASGK